MEHTRQNVLPNPNQKPIQYGSKRIGNADFGTSSHCVHRLIYHVVFVTKFRRQVFTSSRLKYLLALFPRICSHYQYRLIEVNGESDPIHLLIECPPTASLSLYRPWWADSSTSQPSSFSNYGAQGWGNHKHTLWNSGYFVASTGGVTLDILKKYVENQGRS